jgi:glycosyltransferase involved in cell wall biosynthesis
VERYFAPDTLATYYPGDAEDLARTVLSLVDDAAARESRIEATCRRVDELSWARQARSYVAVVERMVRKRAAKAPRRRA